MRRRTSDTSKLTISGKQLLSMTVQDRLNALRNNPSYFEQLTPTELAKLFPKQYLQQLPDMGKSLSGGVPTGRREQPRGQVPSAVPSGPGGGQPRAPAPGGQDVPGRQAAPSAVPSAPEQPPRTPGVNLSWRERLAQITSKEHQAVNKENQPLDAKNSSPAQRQQAVYDAFRKLGYTHFGAMAMVRETGRENNFNPNMMFGTHQDPAKPSQTNFGIFSMAGIRSKALYEYLKNNKSVDSSGMVIQNQKTIDLMAKFIDQDMKTNSTKWFGSGAVIKGQDPRELPDKLRDPRFGQNSEEDLHNAHRGLASYILWQHPEIFGGKYRKGIAGQRHYEMMLKRTEEYEKNIKKQSESDIVYIGDSVARGYAKQIGRGTSTDPTQVGRQPEDILKYIKENPISPGTTVRLSTGILNSHGQRKDVIEKMMEELKKQGAKIQIIGTPIEGPNNHNDYLQELAKQHGAKFLGGYKPASDGVHPEKYSPENFPRSEEETRRNTSIMASSLEDPAKSFTKESVEELIKKGKKYFEINYDFKSAKNVEKIIEDAGGTVVAYNRGQGNNEYKNEHFREAQAVVNEIKRIGKKYQHLDNTEFKNMPKYEDFKYIVDEAKALGITLIPKNPHLDSPEKNHWIRYLKENPNYKFPYAIVENIGRMSETEENNLKKFKELSGSQINGLDWKGNKPSDKAIEKFQKNFGPVTIAEGDEKKKGYVFDLGATEYPSLTGPQVLPVKIASTDIKDYDKLPEKLRQEIDALSPEQQQEVMRNLKEAEKKFGNKWPEEIKKIYEQGTQQATSAAPIVKTETPIQGVVERQAVVAGIRTLPLKNELKSYLNYATAETGVNFEVTSGGQTRDKQTGSYRHNIDIEGTYGAADGRLYVEENGQRRYLSVYNKEDLSLINKYIEAFTSVAPSAGIGTDYMGSGRNRGELFHIGGPNRPGDPSINYSGSEYIGPGFQRGLELYKNKETKERFKTFMKQQEEAEERQRKNSVVPTEHTRATPPAPGQPPAATPQAVPQAAPQTAPAPPVKQRGITDYAGATPPAPTAVPKEPAPPETPPEQQTKGKGEVPQNKYGGEYQAPEDLVVADARTGVPQFSFNKDEEFASKDGRLKVTPDRMKNPDDIQPRMQPEFDTSENKLDQRIDMSQNTITQTPPTQINTHNNFIDRLDPPGDIGVSLAKAYAQSTGFHNYVSANYPSGTAGSIKTPFDTLVR